MTANPVALHRADPVRKAVQVLLEQRMLGIPVVESDGRYAGMFARSELIAVMMPRVLALADRLPEIARMLDVGYISDSIDDVRARYRAVADDPVEKHMQTDAPVLRPDSPIITTLLFLHRTRNFLPVVEEKTGKLVGIVSTWDVLARISA
jgi:CBS domain-containing protein